ncbi:GTPase-activating protein [Clydaea vesicula]|uniref:GTPase-activating protein n=1 Tax=Clydaea vesicula TaxID=447962 RepID=A0AAD5U016_9FUNG|nr:GTPase-activating protein [Clydaea vesicula]
MCYAIWFDMVNFVFVDITYSDLFSAAFAGAALPLTTIIFGDLIDTFGRWGLHIPGVPDLTPTQLTDKVNGTIVYFVYLGVGTFITTYLYMAAFVASSEKITNRIRNEYLKGVLRQDIAWFDKEGAGEVATRISSDTLLIQDAIGEKVPICISQICTTISAFVIGFIKSWKLTLVLMSMFPLIALSSGLANVFASKFQIKILSLYSVAGTIAEETFSCVRTVVAFNGQLKMSKRYAAELSGARKMGIKKATVMGLATGFMFFIIYCGYSLAFWFGKSLLQSGEVTAGNVTNVFFAVLIGSFSLGHIAPDLQAFALGKGAASKIYYSIARQPSIRDDSNLLTISPDQLKGKIELKNVKFTYPSRPDVPILKSVSITANAGQSVALVGGSGSGKSTIIQLLERFYDPLEGSIEVDSVPISNLQLHWLRRQIGLVSQEPTLFEGSVFDNVCHGLIGSKWETSSSEEKKNLVLSACVKANAHDFISKLPKGYDTPVGQRGLLLSGGQKQRIAIARAIVKDPKILLLDEATSALDTNSERIVQDALDKASKGRTTITIAHRLSTIRHCDLIVVMSQGEIVEQGTHEDLLKLENGFYKALVAAQKLNNESNIPEKVHTDEKVEDIPEVKADLEQKKRESLKISKDDLETAVLKKLGGWRIFRGILALNIPDLKFLIPGFIAAIVAGMVYPFFAIVFGTIIGVFTKKGEQLESESNYWAAMFVVIAVVTLISNFAMNSLFGYASEFLTQRIRKGVFDSILNQDISFFDETTHGTGILTASLSSDAQKIQGMSGLTLGNIITVFTNLAGCMIVALINGWQLALVAIAMLPLLVFSGYFRLKIINYFSEKAKGSYEQSAQVASEAVSGIRTIQSLTREQQVSGIYENILLKPLQDGVKSAWTNTSLYAFSTAINFFVNALVFWYGGICIAYNGYTVSTMFTVFIAIVFGSQSAGRIFSYAPDLSKASEAGANILTLLKSKPLIDSSSTLGEKADFKNGEVEFKDVYFQYPTRKSVRVLEGLNLKVTKGQFVALVGPSGCGKSTTVGLIERFYNPVKGKIFVDGKDISLMNVQQYRNRIGLVSQEPNLFDMSIRDNIAFGLDYTPTQEEVERACKDSNIHEFIVSLPNGYNTNVGSKGSQLSGGQKQRIAIARALIRNPTILLLDEATSALDAQSEKVVQQALDNASKGRTTISIAHRLSTIQHADVIYVFKDGVVSESGSHSELLEKRGLYYDLVQHQDLEKP